MNLVLGHLFRHKQEDLLGDIDHLFIIQNFFVLLFVFIRLFVLLLVISLIFILFVFVNAICLFSLFFLGLFGGLRLFIVALRRWNLHAGTFFKRLGIVAFNRFWLILLQIVYILEVLEFLGLLIVDSLVLGNAHILFRVVVYLVLDLRLGFLLQVWIAQL